MGGGGGSGTDCCACGTGTSSDASTRSYRSGVVWCVCLDHPSSLKEACVLTRCLDTKGA